MTERAEKTAREIVSRISGTAFDWAQIFVNDGHADFKQGEQAFNNLTTIIDAAFLEVEREQRERDCKLLCGGCREGAPLTGTVHHWTSPRGQMQCQAIAIRNQKETPDGQ